MLYKYCALTGARNASTSSMLERIVVRGPDFLPTHVTYKYCTLTGARKASTSSMVESVVVRGPDFLPTHATMVSAVRPPIGYNNTVQTDKTPAAKALYSQFFK
jgi:hypothetical protein